MSKMLEIIRRNPLRSLAVLGAGGAVGYKSYKAQKLEKESKHHKKVLVLPFYKMKIVEETKKDFASLLAMSSKRSDRTEIMEVDQVVSLIHEAASDPDIVALYGVLGHGTTFSTGGWAHIEEIRNALLVFQQAHRVHYEPGKISPPAPTPKPLYLYSNTFALPAPNGGTDMKSYYLASAFTHIHLQPTGDLNLFGMHTTDTFFRDFLDKYGIRVHVWKHGAYKNAANRFTHSSYTREHAANVGNLLTEINQHVCHGIYFSRYGQLKNYEYYNFWKMVLQAGSFPASMAKQIGFVDYLPKLNPLDDLLDQPKKDEGSEEDSRLAKWGDTTNLEDFKATKAITIMDYARQKKKEKAKQERQLKMLEKFETMPSGIKSLLQKMLPTDKLNVEELDSQVQGCKEKIAVLKIGGPITDAMANKLDKPLRMLQKDKDVKAVVLRVDSPGGAVTACETIHQRIQDLPQKVVVSFGNVSASGGYYISANTDRIFASPTTITGSIGVLMLRLDFRGLAQQWGITFDSTTTGNLSGSFDPFYPVNDLMKQNFASYTDRSYLHFKELVCKGRGLDMADLERIAQGRVWTGAQAKEIGLVDELGGLDRAVAHCQRTYTESGHAKVVAWPPKKSLFQALTEMGNEEDDDLDDVELPGAAAWVLNALGGANSWSKSSTETTANTELSLESLVRTGRLPGTTGLMMTLDENTAFRCFLEDNDVPDVFSSFPPSFWE
eukprot:Nitzschia sp. Nitz4//scaffold14_size191712//148848//151091//NITZ4_001747-RA/size191712-processed-gene-0.287-mRNA-1//1//CDS//3329536999//8190//frame0